ncbi:amidase [Pseudomonas sp. 21LCFQ02]|uniref:amidase n=1 Tax=Pseudomonas sp. 21LCFQ02 TaxID=2957505 RepID=UPI00209B5F22|nr:amidase [Pseudomonas sp. 21LCFQ02]MCO8166539.1 amidase [Pseudomonas sp. 21LCFQ02]
MSRQKNLIRRHPLLSMVLPVLPVLIVLAVWAWQHRVALQVFPDIISAYTAKEYCSCRYVTGNPAQYCRSYVKQYLPATLQEDQATRTVTASGLGRSSRAMWLGQRQGCRLL